MKTDSSLSSTLGRRTVRSATKLVLTAVSLLLLAILLRLLPGLDLVVPRSAVSVVAVLTAAVTIAVVGLLLILSPRLSTVAAGLISGSDEVADMFSSLVFWLLILGAVLLAHTGLSAVFVPILGGFAWLYDLVFLVLAVPPVVFIAIWQFSLLDPTAELISERVVE